MMTGPSGAASGAQRNCPGCRFWAVAAIEPSSSLAWANAGGIAKPNALIVAVASKERRVRCEAEPIVIQHLVHGTIRGKGMKKRRWKTVHQSWCRNIDIRTNTIRRGRVESIVRTKLELGDHRWGLAGWHGGLSARGQ